MFIVLHRLSSGLPEWFQVTNMDRYRDEDGGSVVFQGSDFTEVRETPAEIMALVAKAQRERDRVTIAARLMAAAIGGEYVNAQQEGFSAARDLAKDAVYRADALLAALNAREGE